MGTLAMQLHKYRVYIRTKDEKHHKKLPSVLPVFVLGVKKTKGDDMMTPYGKRVRSIVHWPMNMLSHTQWGEILSKGAFLFLCNCVFTRYFGTQFSYPNSKNLIFSIFLSNKNPWLVPVLQALFVYLLFIYFFRKYSWKYWIHSFGIVCWILWAWFHFEGKNDSCFTAL